MSSQQSTADPRIDDDWDAYSKRYRRYRATTPRDRDKPWQINRKSFKEIKRRTHKRERQLARFDMMSE